jgi:hypothetical protein
MKCALSVRKLATVKQKAEVHTERERERKRDFFKGGKSLVLLISSVN